MSVTYCIVSINCKVITMFSPWALEVLIGYCTSLDHQERFWCSDDKGKLYPVMGSAKELV